jgi:cell division septation protein DedD
MKVICPSCHFENQCNSSQVYCGRCATLIDVRSQRDDLSSGGGRSGLPLPYAGNGNGYDDELTSNPGTFAGGPRTRRDRDAYATRIGDDFDDLLEINSPGAGQGGWPNGGSGGERRRGKTTPLDVEGLFEQLPPAGQGADRPLAGRETVEVGRPEYPGQTWQSEDGSAYDQGSGPILDAPGGRTGRETREFNEDLHSNLMGWPVLTDSSDLDNSDDREDSMARQGIGMRILLGAAVFAGLIGGAYFFLGDLISKRQDQAEGLAVNERTSGAPVTGPTLSPTPDVQTSQAPAGAADAAGGSLAAGGQSQPIDIPPVIGRNANPELPVPVPVVPEPAPAPSVPASGDWTIQVASFNNRGQADERLASLKGAGIPARVARVDIPGKGTWYRVQIGGFDSREEGTRYGNQLRSRGAIQDFIVTPR